MNKEIKNLKLKKLITFSILLSFLSICFVIIYGGCNYLASIRENHFKFYFDWELSIPFVPWMVYIYLSLNLIFFLPLFFCSIKSMFALTKAFLFSLISAGLVFIIFPTSLGFQRKENIEDYNEIFQSIYQLDHPHNLLPSLHITFSLLIFLIIYQQRKNQILLSILSLWFMLICLSVLFIHQHHVLDIIAGIILAFLSYRFIYLGNLKYK